MTNNKTNRINSKVALKIIKYSLIVFLIVLFIVYTVSDFLNFSSIDENSILHGTDTELRLLARIIEINPNTGYAKIDFSIIEETYSDSTLLKTTPKSFDLMIFSGGAIKLSNNTTLFENESRYHSDFVKLTDSKTINLGNYTQKTYLANPIEIKVHANPKGYLFPFDKYTLRINFELIDKKGKNKYPTIDTKLEDNKFFSSKSIRNFTHGNSSEFLMNSFFLQIYRPNYVAINFSIIILISLCIVFWSYYRILSKTVVSAFEVLGLNITILISFPGLRAILVPSNLEYAPLFDFTSTIIWILSLTAIITYLSKDLINKH